MEQFLLASHGSLARAMKETAAFLLGTNENVHCLCAYVDEASMNLEQMVGSGRREGKQKNTGLSLRTFLGAV